VNAFKYKLSLPVGIALNETPVEVFCLVSLRSCPFIDEDGLDSRRLSQGAEKSGWFFYSCEVLF
jgi:hypothetical protein